jgi:hypothetical protein
MRHFSAFFVLVMLIGCGWNTSTPAFLVSVTPATATVKVGGTVALTGLQNGFANHPTCAWAISESGPVNSSHSCGKFDTEPKDYTGCPYGFVMYQDADTIPSIATYYAGTIPGIYHVIWDVSQTNPAGPVAERWTIVTITVTQ